MHARSPDMTPCVFYLWGRLKNAVYKTKQRSLKELKLNIRDEINNINRGELKRAMGNVIKRCQKWLDNEGGQFQHLLSVKLVSTTICKILREMWLVVSPRSFAVCYPPLGLQLCIVK